MQVVLVQEDEPVLQQEQEVQPQFQGLVQETHEWEDLNNIMYV